MSHGCERETSEVEIVFRSQNANLILERERLSRIGEQNHSSCSIMVPGCWNFSEKKRNKLEMNRKGRQESVHMTKDLIGLWQPIMLASVEYDSC